MLRVNLPGVSLGTSGERLFQSKLRQYWLAWYSLERRARGIAGKKYSQYSFVASLKAQQEEQVVLGRRRADTDQMLLPDISHTLHAYRDSLQCSYHVYIYIYIYQYISINNQLM